MKVLPHINKQCVEIKKGFLLYEPILWFSLNLFRNQSLWTPLDCAASRGWVKSARVLLDADCPVDPTDKAKVSINSIQSTPTCSVTSY